jgi:hypothetical protein
LENSVGTVADVIDAARCSPSRLTPAEVAAVVVAFHDMFCRGAELVRPEIDCDLPPIPEEAGDERAAVMRECRRELTWAFSAQCVSRLRDDDRDWLIVLERRFREYVTAEAEQTPALSALREMPGQAGEELAADAGGCPAVVPVVSGETAQVVAPFEAPVPATDAPNDGTPPPPADEPADSRPRAITGSIKKDGAAWEVRFGGERGIFPENDYSAFADVAKLVASPRISFGITDLGDVDPRALA